MPFYRQIFLFLSAAVLFSSCNSELPEDETVPDKAALDTIEITDGWARPGMQGNSSAAYLTIINSTESPDTLVGIFTEAAEVAELHGSYENDAGIISMKPAAKPVIEAGEALRLEPGGLHIMLMELNRDLTAGDSLRLSLKFTGEGTKEVVLPVRVQ